MSDTEVGVLIARFQTHKLVEAHLNILNSLRSKYAKVLVLLTTPAIKATIENPLDYPSRAEMIRTSFPDVLIQPLADTSSDGQWSWKIDVAIREAFGALVKVSIHASSDAAVPFYIGTHKILPLPPKIQQSIAGVKASLKNDSALMGTPAWRAGMVHSSTARFDLSYQRVDVVPYRIEKGNLEILLLSREENEGLFSIGGSVLTKDLSLEEASKRELWDQVGVRGLPKYVGSTRVNDWRFRFERDKVLSSVFVVGYIPQQGLSSLKGVTAKWFSLSVVSDGLLVADKSTSVLYVAQEHLLTIC